jgi:hypothetical protein
VRVTNRETHQRLLAGAVGDVARELEAVETRLSVLRDKLKKAMASGAHVQLQ